MAKRPWIKYLTMVAVCFGFAWAALYPFVSPLPTYDFKVFLSVGRGEIRTDYYYAPWIVPFYTLVGLFPDNVARSIAFVISTAGFLLALNTFKGNKILFFFSYPFLTSIYWGQPDGVFAGSLAIMYLAIKKEEKTPLSSTLVAGFAWFIACAKFHIGIPLGFGIWWLFARDKPVGWRIIGVMAVLGLLSVVVYPGWISAWLERNRALPPDRTFTVDVWDQVGAPIFLLWIPVFLSRTRDYRWWVATWALTVPYLHHHGLTHLLTVPVGPIGWLVDISFFTGLTAATYLLIVPAVVYVLAWRESWKTDWLALLLARRRSQPQPLPVEQVS
ncbi:MAG TPA: hypothetical protein VHL11_04495 [Phototrophicaceae bacterium]|jgi:putative effector of murein hydrolase LrgA (UPF0299 family)|nr:hypothetical protein [Phototrophicaceae bacterium]